MMIKNRSDNRALVPGRPGGIPWKAGGTPKQRGSSIRFKFHPMS